MLMFYTVKIHNVILSENEVDIFSKRYRFKRQFSLSTNFNYFIIEYLCLWKRFFIFTYLFSNNEEFTVSHCFSFQKKTSKPWARHFGIRIFRFFFTKSLFSFSYYAFFFLDIFKNEFQILILISIKFQNAFLIHYRDFSYYQILASLLKWIGF